MTSVLTLYYNDSFSQFIAVNVLIPLLPTHQISTNQTASQYPSSLQEKKQYKNG